MDRNVLGIIVSFAFIFAVIFLAGLLKKLGQEASRKFVHIGVSNWWLIAMAYFTSPVWAAVVPASFVVLNYLSYKYGLFKSMERQGGKEDLGTVYYAISLLILSILTFGDGGKPYLGAVGILVMGYGDGLAAVVGKALGWGKYKIFGANKSAAGSLTMFVASFAVTGILMAAYAGGFDAGKAALVAAVATVLEAATPLGFDNLTVPLGTYAALILMGI